MSSYRTQGKDEARSTAVGGSLKELTPRKPKSIIKTDFTFDHYNLENTFANFDTISFGSDVAGKASLVIRFTGDPGNGKKITLTDAAGTAAAQLSRLVASLGGCGTAEPGESPWDA